MAPRARPAKGARSRTGRGRLVALLVALLTGPGAATAADDTAGAEPVDLGALPGRAADFARSAALTAYPDAEVTVSMVPLDPRLTLAPCASLEFTTPGSRSAGRVSIHARCHAPATWGIYLTAQVSVVLPVVTVAGPVPRDTVLRATDLTLQPADLAELRDGYLTDVDDALGLVARGALRAGAILYQRQLAAPKLVTRGDPVTLASQRGQIVVTTQAIALSDGVYGDKVDVRNPRSERVVSGWVVGPARVSTRP